VTWLDEIRPVHDLWIKLRSLIDWSGGDVDVGLTTDRTDDCLRIMRADGMQECSLVLSEEERGKGFVRPVRRSYKHLKCGTVTTMAQAIAETYARDPSFYGGTFCCGCGDHFLLREGPVQQYRALFAWEPDGTPVGS